MNILVDMNLSPGWCKALSVGGHICQHWSQIGDPRAQDAELFLWARNNGFIILTHDLDFSAILAATHAQGPSVIQLRTQDLLDTTSPALVLQALAQYEREIQNGAVLVVDGVNLRVRILPL